ncbi:MAG: hypothetical protein ACRD9S_07750 [Pyrinomonadaceae bacterium]
MRDARQAKAAKLTLSLQALLDSREAIQSLIGQPLPASVSFRLARLVNAIGPEFEAYETTRKKICEQYGTLNAETSVYDFEPEQQKLFTAAYAELVNSEIQVPGEKFQVALLSAAKLSTVDMLNLDWLIVE